MNLKYYIIVLLVFMLSASQANAQEREVAKGNKKFNQYAFVDSQKIYLKVAESGYESADLFSKLGDSFYYNADYSDAVTWYSKLVEKFAESVTPDQYFRYAQALRAVENYSESDEMIARYQELMDASGEAYYDPNTITKIRSERQNFTINTLNVNATGY